MVAEFLGVINRRGRNLKTELIDGHSVWVSAIRLFKEKEPIFHCSTTKNSMDLQYGFGDLLYAFPFKRKSNLNGLDELTLRTLEAEIFKNGEK